MSALTVPAGAGRVVNKVDRAGTTLEVEETNALCKDALVCETVFKFLYHAFVFYDAAQFSSCSTTSFPSSRFCGSVIGYRL